MLISQRLQSLLAVTKPHPYADLLDEDILKLARSKVMLKKGDPQYNINSIVNVAAKHGFKLHISPGSEFSDPLVKAKVKKFSREIHLNMDHVGARGNFWSNPRDNQIIEYNRADKSGHHILHTVIHELGHIKYTASAHEWSKVTDSKFSVQEMKKLAGKVSIYAEKSPEEFIVEVFAGIHTGHKYSEDTMALYREFINKLPNYYKNNWRKDRKKHKIANG